jgi:UDP-N-acetylglucosamine acyltransferase
MIHPTAVIHPQARIDANCSIGPCTVIDGDVVIGPDCEIGPHVYITGRTEIGPRNKIHAGCVIGDWPQDLRFKGGPTGVVIGPDNVFREHVTIHRSNNPEEPTRIGSNCLLMVNSHVGHNTAVGNHVIIVNGTLLAGHVTVQDRAFISANCMIHQFVRIGTLALMQGGAGASKDLPPYTIARDNNRISGLNVIGLRRAGFTSEERLELRRLYHLLFRSGRTFSETLAEARTLPLSAKATVLVDFLATGRRGFCSDWGAAGQSEEES